MKYLAVVPLAILAALLVGCSGNGSHGHASHAEMSGESANAHSDEHGNHHADDEGMGSMAVSGNTTCPVMEGEAIDPDVFVEYRGKKVFFCCDDCLDKFNRDPAAYFAKAYPGLSGD